VTAAVKVLLAPREKTRRLIHHPSSRALLSRRSCAEPGGKVWYHEDVSAAEIAFEADVYLLTKALAEKLRSGELTPPSPETPPPETPTTPEGPDKDGGGRGMCTIVSVAGSIPPEQWNRLGTRLIPKMRAAGSITATIRLEGEVDSARAPSLSTELQQIIEEIGLSNSIQIERGSRLGDSDERTADR
jgi:hypothetical protein